MPLSPERKRLLVIGVTVTAAALLCYGYIHFYGSKESHYQVTSTDVPHSVLQTATAHPPYSTPETASITVFTITPEQQALSSFIFNFNSTPYVCGKLDTRYSHANDGKYWPGTEIRIEDNPLDVLENLDDDQIPPPPWLVQHGNAKPELVTSLFDPTWNKSEIGDLVCVQEDALTPQP